MQQRSTSASRCAVLLLLLLLLLGVAIAGCSGSSAAPAEPADASTDEPVTATVASTTSAAVVPVGYPSSRATITGADGEVCELCLWIADSDEERAKGLMFVTDLGDADGMAFVYPSARTGSFWMKNTMLPLSIAFFDADGGFQSALKMEPCTADPCASYPTAADMLIAVEFPQGDLAAFGVAAGARLTILDLPCE